MNYSSIILPTDVRQQYLLCYMKHYLEHCEAKTFTSNEIAESLLGDLVKGSEVTRLLTSLKFSPKKNLAL